ncbi:isochorismatase family cysteine hydrolase [Mycobacterium sp. 134]|uniref:isochorismatase family cysteine hydrolase n=1 Tax=unclassified Mycobacterium TaxID=2642494 RepID=UPI0007FD2D7E|nr:isochorismatase family cysteine hydrolase [Mycobacterium sp. E802]OBG80435.1 isochorismatase [Mycobacterium sp. E802]
MASELIRSERTGLLLVDPYNDWLSDEGKLWPRIRDVAGKVNLLENLSELLNAVRGARIQVFVVPHRRWEPGDYEDWLYPNPTQELMSKTHAFARGEWGGEWYPPLAPQRGDVIVKEHWAQSGFANTDLDFQIKQRGITHLIVAGLLANTCIESTARAAMELGYHVTLVRDATVSFSAAMMNAAHALNGPTYAHDIVDVAEIVSRVATATTPLLARG